MHPIRAASCCLVTWVLALMGWWGHRGCAILLALAILGFFVAGEADDD